MHFSLLFFLGAPDHGRERRRKALSLSLSFVNTHSRHNLCGGGGDGGMDGRSLRRHSVYLPGRRRRPARHHRARHRAQAPATPRVTTASRLTHSRDNVGILANSATFEEGGGPIPASPVRKAREELHFGSRP